MEGIEEKTSAANYFENRLPSSDVGGAAAPPCVHSGSSGAEDTEGKQNRRWLFRDPLRAPAVGRWAMVGGRWRPLPREEAVHDGSEAEGPAAASSGGEPGRRKRPGICRVLGGDRNEDEAAAKLARKVRLDESNESKGASGAASRAPANSTGSGRPLVDDVPRLGFDDHGDGGPCGAERGHGYRECGGNQGDEEAMDETAGGECDTVERQAERSFTAAEHMPTAAESLGQVSSSASICSANGGYGKGGAECARGNLNDRELAPVQVGGVHACKADLAAGSGCGGLGGAGSSAGSGARGEAAARGCSWERGGAARGGALPRGPRREA